MNPGMIPGTNRQVTALIFALAACATGHVAADESLRVESVELSDGLSSARLAIEATTATGAIDAYVVSLTYDPRRATITDLVPAGDWLDQHVPDFFIVTDMSTASGDPGKAALMVIMDLLPGDSSAHQIPTTPDGDFQVIAEMALEITEAANDDGATLPVELRLEDDVVGFGDGPVLRNNLGVSGVDFFEGNPRHPLKLIRGGLFPPLQPGFFLRADADASGQVDISDPIRHLICLFIGGVVIPCPDAGDADDDGILDITDAILVLIYLFLGTAEIAEPGASTCGPDPTADTLAACEYPIENCPP
jgi:hypothetical protein